jgi:hypothetical protein
LEQVNHGPESRRRLGASSVSLVFQEAYGRTLEISALLIHRVPEKKLIETRGGLVAPRTGTDDRVAVARQGTHGDATVFQNHAKLPGMLFTGSLLRDSQVIRGDARKVLVPVIL